MKLRLIHPLKNVSISQGFGVEKTSPDMLPKYQAIGLKGHNGYDYVAKNGTEVLSMHDGTVVYAGLDGSNGNLIVLMTDKMYEYKNGETYFKTFYGHLKTGSFKVTAGDKVKQGQVIALSNNSGMSTGEHLHIGVKSVMQGEQPWIWYNTEQNEGFNGAINPADFLPPVEEFQSPIKFGDESYDVEKLQAFLIRNKYMQPVSKLGFYGKVTSTAVLKFQIENIPNLSFYEKYVLKGKYVGEKTKFYLNKLY